MKGIVLTGICEIEMRDLPDPEIKQENEVLIRMTKVGVCGSDVHYYATGRIGDQIVEYPFTVGHEGAGIVQSVGPGVTRVKPGDRIAVEPAMPCWKCDQCKAGRPHTCRNLKFLGCPQQAAGCLSEFIVVPEECCIKIPDSMSFEEAAISEPLAIGLYAVKQSGDMKGKRIGIIGSGPIGLSVLMPALSMGAEKAYVVDKIDRRLQIATTAGACWTGNPSKDDIVSKIEKEEPGLLDTVFECCGEQEAVDQAIKILKPGGMLVIVGIPPTLDEWILPAHEIRLKEICIKNVRRQNHCVEQALDMITNKEFDVNIMVTHRFNLDEAKSAFKMVDNYEDGVLKAMISL